MHSIIIEYIMYYMQHRNAAARLVRVPDAPLRCRPGTLRR